MNEINNELSYFKEQENLNEFCILIEELKLLCIPNKIFYILGLHTFNYVYIDMTKRDYIICLLSHYLRLSMNLNIKYIINIHLKERMYKIQKHLFALRDMMT